MELARKRPTRYCCMREIIPSLWWTPIRIGFSGATGSPTASRTMKSPRADLKSLPRDPQLFNEFHALIVNTGKNWCRKSVPRCEECPLRSLLPANSPLSSFPNSSPGIRAISLDQGVIGVSTAANRSFCWPSAAWRSCCCWRLFYAGFADASLPTATMTRLWFSTRCPRSSWRRCSFLVHPDAQPGAALGRAPRASSPARVSRQKWFWAPLPFPSCRSSFCFS
jgi:hypothetical protein